MKRRLLVITLICALAGLITPMRAEGDEQMSVYKKITTSATTPYIHTITMNDNSTVALVTNNSKYSLRYNTEWKDFRYYKKTSTGSNIPDISLYRFAYTKAVSILPVVTIRDTLCHDEDYTIDGEDKQSCVGREYDKASGQRQHPHISNLCTVMPVRGK